MIETMFYRTVLFLFWLFPRRVKLWLCPPDYFIYTHRKGWMHISTATEQDKEEMSGFCPTPPLRD